MRALLDTIAMPLPCAKQTVPDYVARVPGGLVKKQGVVPDFGRFLGAANSLKFHDPMSQTLLAKNSRQGIKKHNSRAHTVVRGPHCPSLRQPTREYHRKLRLRATRFRANLDAKRWCDMWHTHFDWDGLGELGWLHRRRHIRAMLRALTRAKSELSGSGRPCQTFALIHPRRSADDGLYLHTPNPNGTPFPVQFDDGVEMGAAPPLLMGCVDLVSYRLIKHGLGSETYFSVQPRSQPSLIRQACPEETT